jgi:hypothetical protein
VLSLSPGTYHTAKKHPQIHSQHKLLVPSVHVLFTRSSFLAEFILEPRKKSWFLSSTEQQLEQFYAIGKMQVSELKRVYDPFRNGDFIFKEIRNDRNRDLKYIYQLQI